MDPVTAAGLIVFGVKAAMQLEQDIQKAIQSWAKKDDPSPQETDALIKRVAGLLDEVKDDVPGTFEDIP
jgi:hypothetical protein